jgi:F-type H+-transporting ATPase subunit O
LDNKTLNRLETAVSKSSYVGQGKKLKVTNKVRFPLDLFPCVFIRTNMISQVNPEIVGGLVVEIGDRTIDLSVSSKVSRMNKLLQDTL